MNSLIRSLKLTLIFTFTRYSNGLSMTYFVEETTILHDSLATEWLSVHQSLCVLCSQFTEIIIIHCWLALVNCCWMAT
jgi:hypothetical protein